MGQRIALCPWLTLLALTPAVCILVAVPCASVLAVVELHGYAMLGTPVSLRGVVSLDRLGGGASGRGYCLRRAARRPRSRVSSALSTLVGFRGPSRGLF